MEDICSANFTKIFVAFNNKLNAIFQGKTKKIPKNGSGGSIKIPKESPNLCQYKKDIASKAGVTIEINVVYDIMKDEYLFYTYNIFFDKNKLMFHYEPTHKEHFQPHINVYFEAKEFINLKGEGIHIISHKYHLFEILAFIERYFA